MREPSDSSDITPLDPTTALMRPGKNNFTLFYVGNEGLSGEKTSLELVYPGLAIVVWHKILTKA